MSGYLENDDGDEGEVHTGKSKAVPMQRQRSVLNVPSLGDG